MYGKYFASTFTGSMVGAGPCTFAVWGYVIANCKNGTVEINPTILAAILGATKEDVEKAIEYLSAPDPESRSKVLDGRRIVKVGAFFYEVPNHATYRGIINDEERREYFRDKKREQREREAKDKEVSESKPRLSLTVKDKSSASTHSYPSSYPNPEGAGFPSLRSEIAAIEPDPILSNPQNTSGPPKAEQKGSKKCPRPPHPAQMARYAPTKEEFNQHMAEHWPNIENFHPDIWEKHAATNFYTWSKGEWKPINYWKQFFDRTEERIENDRTKK